MAASLFERSGGFATVSRIVSCYDRVLDHDRLAVYFEDIDLPRLMDHQTKFIASVMGGPVSYSDEHLRRVHRRFNITNEDFDAMIGLLESTFLEFKFPPEEVAAVIGDVARRRPVIVAGGDGDG